ncbi:hypothetical protein H9P43_002258 [Blastocladiella emersonii ATCC 22665]|nr:hypothetical protein H9P43_002258 [Blastocladiella emersonii ATCC 22665]
MKDISVTAISPPVPSNLEKGPVVAPDATVDMEASHATVLKAQKLLLRLTKALFAFGAPLYRVEMRVQAAADELGLPLSILSLPNAVVLAFGDGTPLIWPQTYIVKGFQGQNMGKLQDVDIWSKKLTLSCEMAIAARKLQLEQPATAGTAETATGAPADTRKTGRIQVSPTKPGTFVIGEDSDDDVPQKDGEDENLIQDGKKGGSKGDKNAIRLEPVTRDSAKTAAPAVPGMELVSPLSPTLPGTPGSPSKGPKKVPVSNLAQVGTVDSVQKARLAARRPLLALTDHDLDRFLDELDRVVNTNTELHYGIRILCTATTSMLMVLMMNPCTWQDLVVSFILGFLNGVLTHYGEKNKINALEVLVPMALSVVGKLFEYIFMDTMCFGMVAMLACFNYFPGVLMTLSMVELASRNLVSGTVRMFYSFIRSLKLGFGLAIGSRLVTWLNSVGLPGIAVPSGNAMCMDKTSRPNTISVKDNIWLMVLVFLPMSVCINIVLRGHPRQWAGMCVASAMGLFTLTLASTVFNKDAAAAQAAFVIGIVSHLQARRKNDIAIASILAGVFWLAPGQIGVRGAAMLMSDDLKGSTSFAIDMLVRALNVSIGLYVSGLLLFPMIRKSKISILSL